MKLALKLSALALIAALPLPASAHKMWIMPSASVLALGQWVTVDAAVSNDIFHFNHVPLRLDNLVVTAPDGSTLAAANPHVGKLRSVFDLELTTPGTYRIAIVNDGLMASWQEDGKPKRWRGNATTFAKEVRSDAEGLEVTQTQGRVETFVTAGAPNDTAIKASGRGLELVPVTHPNDAYAGESSRFTLQLDGKPAADVELTIIAGGTRYRDRQNETVVKSDAQGAIEVTWPAPGMYWLEASISTDVGVTAPATKRRASYVATVEVLPQ